MRATIASCLLIALCTVNADPLDELRALVEKSKNHVWSSQQQLDRLRDDVVQDTIFKIKSKWVEQMQNHNNYSNSIIDAINTEVEAAKAENKDAQPCYDTAVDTLKNVWNVASNDAQRCLDNAESIIKGKLAFVERDISTGRELIKKLDSIFPSCSNNIIFIMRQCITLKLGAINLEVRAFLNRVDSADLVARSASNHAVEQGTNCVYDIYLPAHSQITQVRQDATKCLKAL